MEITETTPQSFEPRIGRSVSLDHAAQILGVSRRTIYNRIREGRLQTIRTLGGSQRVLLDSVQDGDLRGGQRGRSLPFPSRTRFLAAAFPPHVAQGSAASRRSVRRQVTWFVAQV